MLHYIHLGKQMIKTSTWNHLRLYECIYCCIISFPKTYLLKTIRTYYFIFLWVRHQEDAQLLGSSSRCLMRLWWRYWPRLQSSKATLSKRICVQAHSCGCWLRSSVPAWPLASVDLHRWASYGSLLAAPRVSDPREITWGRNHKAFYEPSQR